MKILTSRPDVFKLSVNCTCDHHKTNEALWSACCFNSRSSMLFIFFLASLHSIVSLANTILPSLTYVGMVHCNTIQAVGCPTPFGAFMLEKALTACDDDNRPRDSELRAADADSDSDSIEKTLHSPQKSTPTRRTSIRVASGGTVCTDVSYIGQTLREASPVH